jgi:4-amino-4-deoxy-L-arabinose transferase-like glycosyltransferase
MKAAIVAAVAVRALLIAIGYAVHGRNAFLVSDSHRFLDLARSLAAGAGFTDAGGLPELFRTPAYPLLLAPGVLLGRPVTWALMVNMLTTAAIVALTFTIARRLFASERAAALCALVAAVEPTMLSWSIRVMAEPLVTMCLAAFAYAALRAIETRETKWLAAAALAICAAAYAKPIAYPLVFVVAASSLVALRSPRATAVFAAVCATLLAPWHLRNMHAGGYAGFTTVVDRSLYFAAGASVAARREQVPHRTVQLRMGDRARLAAVDDTARYARMRREGVALIASDPYGYAATHVKGIGKTLLDPGAAEYLRLFGLYSEGAEASLRGGGVRAIVREQPLWFWSSLVLGIALLPLVVLPLYGMFRVPRAKRPAFVLFALLAAYLLVAGGGVPARARFRAPAVPFLVLMSACALLNSRPWGSSSSPARS